MRSASRTKNNFDDALIHALDKPLGWAFVTAGIFVAVRLLPFPTELHYIVGKPIELPYGPEAADDEEIVCALHRKVTETAQALIDHGLAKRRSTDSDAGAGSDAVVL